MKAAAEEYGISQGLDRKAMNLFKDGTCKETPLREEPMPQADEEGETQEKPLLKKSWLRNKNLLSGTKIQVEAPSL